ncbi:MAG: zinc dependent phospholipase C family protein [Oscillospiraceae bacterium]|nr:zinc dependent phospholipase C family protein [Oscillospiraceae bacterium]
MPANYAHYRFGKQLIPALPAEIRQCIQRFRRMFDMGLHGPDIFFYYNPYMKTAVGELGRTYHRQSGAEFFPKACDAAGSEAARAYLYGLLAHYCLDSVCHPYVNKIVDIGEATHVALESEFDRYLLVLDKEPSPHTYDMSKRLKLTRGECMSVAAFYPPATGANISLSVKSMAFSTRFLSSPRRARNRKLLNRIKPSLLDHMIPETESEPLAPYIRELAELYTQALECYPLLLEQLTEYQQTGKPLGQEFEPDFG